MHKPSIILGIETSCDETSAAVLQKTKNGVKILSNVVASSADLQAKYGGIIPEQAAREQLASIIPVVREALAEAFEMRGEKVDLESLKSRSLEIKKSISKTSHFPLQTFVSQIDAIAVTEGPGLIGSLLVGVETAKVLATVWNKPLVPVNHLLGHFYANWIMETGNVASSKYYGKKSSSPLIPNTHPIPLFPTIGLLVSGGHTDLILITDHGEYQYLGGTRDDAAGEAFDKTARLLGLPYPGGPQIAKLAETGNPQAFKLPRPMINSEDFDFSFSGLKTAISNIIQKTRKDSEARISDGQNSGHPDLRSSELSGIPSHSESFRSDLAASIQEAIVDVVVEKTLRAAQTFGVRQILLAGGVAANQRLRKRLCFEVRARLPHVEIYIPPTSLCTDNAAYIAAAAFFNYHPADPLTLQANPSLSLAQKESPASLNR